MSFPIATAANATITINGGASGSIGPYMRMSVDSSGGNSRLLLFANGFLDLSFHNARSTTFGSIEGTGTIFLGAFDLTIGGNNLSTAFSGTIQDGGPNGDTGGSLTKEGTGTTILSGANTYSGGTTVDSGTLLVRNTTGSGTGTGTVQVNAGTLGGTGRISGAVSVGTIDDLGAVLSPGLGGPGALTIQGALTFVSAATYRCEVRTTNVTADKVTAKGVSIIGPGNSPTISLVGLGNTVLTPGTVFTIINNTAATPIGGTSGNLPDGSAITIGNNTYKANYEDGTGNDLTLTVQ
ncbi:MAG TPA: autotransporter-associated beta strand repeat-containing protein [Chthoniobacterales bacterium]